MSLEIMGSVMESQNRLQEYVSTFQFTGLSIDVALRRFLAEFRLPKEGSAIDQIVAGFAAKYYNDHISANLEDFPFESVEACHIMTYSIILLLSDLHNPNNRNPMDKEAFRRNNRGINDGDDFPDAWMDDVFDRVAAAPL